MTKIEILAELKKLPAVERIKVVEEALDMVREDISRLARNLHRQSGREQLKDAARQLLPDYQSSGELTDFTVLDGEDFHA